MSNGLLMPKLQFITSALAPKKRLFDVQQPPARCPISSEIRNLRILFVARSACVCYVSYAQKNVGRVAVAYHLLSLRGTSFFCLPRFLSPISEISLRKPAWSPAAFFCFFFYS